MGPWAGLVARIAAELSEAGLHSSVIAGPAPTLVPDAVLIRPEEPWVSRGADGRPARFGSVLERYAAVCATRVADPASSMDTLYRMSQAVREAASDEGWDWVTVSAMALDETTDAPLFVATVRLTYSG